MPLPGGMHMNRVRRVTISLASAVLAVGVTTSLAATAEAAPPKPNPGRSCPNPASAYPPCAPHPPRPHGGSVSNSVVTPEGTISFTTDCVFSPGESVTILVGSTPVGTTTAGPDGCVSQTVTVPETTSPGSHQLVIQGQNGQVATIPFTVVSGTATQTNASTSPSLPYTGSNDILPLTGAGALLVLAGGATVVVARRRRSHDEPAA